MTRLVSFLLLGAFCTVASGCGGSGGGAQETQCTRQESYTASEAYETCTGWWVFEDCSTAYRTVTRYHTVGYCQTGYTKSSTTCYRNCGWSDWSVDYSHCTGSTSTCARTRTMIPPGTYGQGCDGSDTDPDSTYSCPSIHCPLDGGWSGFTAWTRCSSLEGTCSRSRTCSSPTPARGGTACSGAPSQTESCAGTVCPVDGGWSGFTAWTRCSSLEGTCSRSRTCSSPTPARGGTACSGAPSQTESCAGTVCPVDGDWTDWTDWSHCAAADDGSTCIRQRACTSPTPANGGSACSGATQETEVCGGGVCPVDGGWTPFTDWSHCQSLEGFCVRSRTCTNPNPLLGGAACDGETQEGETCAGNVCPVDGGWSEWAVWSHCSAVDDGSECVRTRTCTSPAAANGGLPCEGSEEMRNGCDGSICPVDGAWTAWGDWTACAPGTQTCAATRCCAAPLPRNTGATCLGDAVKSSLCSGTTCTGEAAETGGGGFGAGGGGETQGGGGGGAGGGSFGRK